MVDVQSKHTQRAGLGLSLSLGGYQSINQHWRGVASWWRSAFPASHPCCQEATAREPFFLPRGLGEIPRALCLFGPGSSKLARYHRINFVIS